MESWAKDAGVGHLKEYVAFERFVNFIVLSRHHDQQFSVEDFSCGDDGTLGIDGFALSINGELVPDMAELEDALSGSGAIEVSITMTQVKTSPSFDLGDLSIFSDASITLLTEDEPPHPNLEDQQNILHRVLQESSRFRENPVCRLYYVTLGTWNNRGPIVRKMDDTRKRLLGSNLFSRVDFHVWGASEVQSNWRAIDSALEVTVQFENRTTLPEVEGVREAYLGVLPGSEFIKLVTDDEGEIRKTLFFDNVRDFQGETDVNADIRQTLAAGDRSRFCVLNNGVTVVAHDLKATGNRLTLVDFQVVNGCQTSHILHSERENLDGVYVPFRLIVTLDDDVAKSITKATNKQGQVTKENLFALSELQKRIEAYFNSFETEPGKRIYYERRSRQWSGSAQVRGTWRVISLRNLMQAFASLYLRIPHTAARYYGDLRDRVGNDVFSDAHNEAYYYSAAYAFCKLDHFFRSGAIARELKPARYHLLAGVRTIYLASSSPEKVESIDKKAEKDCKPFNSFLWDDDRYLESLQVCAKVLVKLAGGQEINRDFGRTRDFTEQYLSELLK
ncbi:AIPR family protein [Streptomyces sp. NBC_00178]|uniref:AIPR family protein n=1 Tax=Streptomyces sp. NBC_00178 TaxID=2975672 RepID=UPI002E2CE90F|nr:AIPR family protein [Streptomyces sp. NBC_00178]